MGIALAIISGFYPSAFNGAFICNCRLSLNNVNAEHYFQLLFWMLRWICHHDHFLFSLLQHVERFGSR